MKKQYIILILAAMLAGVVFAAVYNNRNGSNVSGTHQEAPKTGTTRHDGDISSFAKKRYPGCRILDRDTDDGLTEVKIRHEGREKILLFDGSKWLRTLWEVRREALPRWAVSAMNKIGFGYKNIDDNDNQAVDTPDGLYYAIQAQSDRRPDLIYLVTRRGIIGEYTNDEWDDGRLHGGKFSPTYRDDGEDRFDEGDDEWDSNRHTTRHRYSRDDGEDHFDEGDDEWN